MFEFLRCSEKKMETEVGVAYMRSCSNLSCMYRYEVFECATKYVGVMSVKKIAPPSGLPSVRFESDA